MHVLVWPVAVQGERSAGEVANAVAGFNALPEDGAVPRPDLLIVARGGGSVEDLWSFNEEIVVRAVAASEIPVISAVGHETDVTLVDFAADRRAPTPTGAAEMAAPVRLELVSQLRALEERRAGAVARMIEQRRVRLRDVARALPRPDELVSLARQRLDAVGDRLPRALIAAAKGHEARLARIASRLTPRTLLGRVDAGRERTTLFGERLRPALERSVAQARDRAEKSGRLLEVFSYKATLERGYAAVRGSDGVVASAKAVAPGATLEIEFSDGRVSATAEGDVETGGGDGGKAPAGKKRKKASDAPQGSLF